MKYDESISKTISKIPEYLTQWIVQQNYDLYSAIDQATWRFILQVSKNFFSQYAHQKYLDGLKETGISVESIPRIEDMNRCLNQFGWQAVAVSGFIPPADFMELLSLGVLPIACDMRPLKHICYTPAPDIVHEAAGHAPIISDPDYASYLRSYGEISKKAIVSHEDMDLYFAVRHLSEVSEDANSSQAEMKEARKRFEETSKNISYVSELSQLSRMGWWTFEYGLVGSLSEPKIYGAGLLSSLEESYHVFDKEVTKIPFSIHCIETPFDITRAQPQLFVAPDFQTLKDGLEELANRMAFRRGGLEGLEKAKRAQTVTTAQLNTGVQVSGLLEQIDQDESGRIVYLRYQGPTQLSYLDQELPNQSPKHHPHGFGSPIESITDEILAEQHLEIGKYGTLHLSSGIQILGTLVDIIRKNGTIILISFEHCQVTREAELLFHPDWGRYDMICGEKITSVFGGAADRKMYLEATDGITPSKCAQVNHLNYENHELNQLYAKVRKIRESPTWSPKFYSELEAIYQQLRKEYPQDWLLLFEILELIQNPSLIVSWENSLRSALEKIGKESENINSVIQRGLTLLKIQGEQNVLREVV
jgi:phenylalanine-4-hydroxylase